MRNQDGTSILERIAFIYKYHKYFYNSKCYINILIGNPVTLALVKVRALNGITGKES